MRGMSENDLDTEGPKAGFSATAWFALMEWARQTNDFVLATKARHELERLGVIVRYAQPGRRGGWGEGKSG